MFWCVYFWLVRNQSETIQKMRKSMPHITKIVQAIVNTIVPRIKDTELEKDRSMRWHTVQQAIESNNLSSNEWGDTTDLLDVAFACEITISFWNQESKQWHVTNSNVVSSVTRFDSQGHELGWAVHPCDKDESCIHPFPYQNIPEMCMFLLLSNDHWDLLIPNIVGLPMPYDWGQSLIVNATEPAEDDHPQPAALPVS